MLITVTTASITMPFTCLQCWNPFFRFWRKQFEWFEPRELHTYFVNKRLHRITVRRTTKYALLIHIIKMCSMPSFVFGLHSAEVHFVLVCDYLRFCVCNFVVPSDCEFGVFFFSCFILHRLFVVYSDVKIMRFINAIARNGFGSILAQI